LVLPFGSSQAWLKALLESSRARAKPCFLFQAYEALQ
jgi:hypothetical protein